MKSLRPLRRRATDHATFSTQQFLTVRAVLGANSSAAIADVQQGLPERFSAIPGGTSFGSLGSVRNTSAGIQDVVRRIRGEFLEMPGLRLTQAQAQRLWRLDQTACEAVLGALVDARFLAKTRDGAFVRQDGNSPR